MYNKYRDSSIFPLRTTWNRCITAGMKTTLSFALLQLLIYSKLLWHWHNYIIKKRSNDLLMYSSSLWLRHKSRYLCFTVAGSQLVLSPHISRTVDFVIYITLNILHHPLPLHLVNIDKDKCTLLIGDSLTVVVTNLEKISW